MLCAHCGAEVAQGLRFCNKCGQPVVGGPASSSAAQPLPPPQSSIGGTSLPGPSAGFARPSRLARHVGVLGALWIVISILRLIPGLALLAFGQMRYPFILMPVPGSMPPWLAPFLGSLGMFFLGFAIAGGIAGWGLMAHCPWARMLAIVLACVSLVHIPFGTALGIYTLCVLVPEGADAEYQSLARVN